MIVRLPARRGLGDLNIGSIVSSVTVESSYTRPFDIDLANPSSGGADAFTNALMGDIQPSFTFRGPLGQYVLAPFGTPTPGKGATLALNLGVGITAGALGLMLLGRVLIP